ncbi:MAG: RHS repeat-associated core domain-containing protein [Cyanobacteriota bacterium]|nr:RHS repeat-associated core domain-containing protein [Cyanobacteriota bacterium]
MESINRYSDLDGSQLVTGSTYSYDEKNRLQNLSHGSTAFYEFEYDGGDRITQIIDVDGTTNYEYDKTNQLTDANRSDPNNQDESYSYDANGNRVTSHLHDSDYVTGGNNRLESDGTYSYEYDGEGNLIRRTEVATNKVTQYSWDYRNRLVAVTEIDEGGNVTKEVEFTYSATGDRLSKTVDDIPSDDEDGVTTYFVSDRDDVLLEFVDADGVGDASEPVLAHRYLHGPGVDQILAREDADGETVWHLTDHLGTVRDLVDNDGLVLNHLVYDSFGNVVSQTDETVGSRYRFTGREFDEETGLYYYRARYYDGDVGRFISSDPIGFESGDVNLYRYVGNSPVDRVDPLGLRGTVNSQVRTIIFEVGLGALVGGLDMVNNIKNVPNSSEVYMRFDTTLAMISFTNNRAPSRRNPNPPPPGKLENDENGHIVTRELGGSDRDTNNFFAQNGDVNQGDPYTGDRGRWRSFERLVTRKLNEKNRQPCPTPVSLLYFVNLFYLARIPEAPLRPSGLFAMATFSDGEVHTVATGNPR